MVKGIITDLDALSQRSDEFNLKKKGTEVRELIVNLKDTVREYNLTSLSGIQIGSPLRVLVINFNGEIRSFCNPIITAQKGIKLSREKCASIPNKEYLTTRYSDIGVAYLTPLGEPRSTRLVGVAAEVFQHALDHLDGLLISDFGLEIDDDFDAASEEEREEVIKAYLDSLDIKVKELKKEIEEDKDLRDLDNAIELMEAVQKGEIELVNKDEFESEKDK